MHSCSRAATTTSRCRRRGTSRMIADLLHATFSETFQTPTPNVVVAMAQKEFGVNVHYSTAWRARKLVANYVRGTPEEGYGMLFSYLHILKQVNPGTQAYVQLEKDTKRFMYLFFALGACIEGFKLMRKVIIIDAAHLKTGEGGVLCVATAQDGNHHNYPVAFGVIDGEKVDGWTWFLTALKKVVPDMPELVFMSDRHPSIKNAIENVYPLSTHGYCNYHLAQNIKTKCHTKSVVTKFLECSKAYTEGEFLTLYAAFGKRYPAALAYLEGDKNKPKEKPGVPKEKWARCYFPADRYNIDSSNPVESVNSVLLNARRLPVVPMIDAILQKVGKWFCDHRKASGELLGTSLKVVPFVDIVIHNLCMEAHTLIVTDLNYGNHQYSVLGRDSQTYYVDLMAKSCTCKHFDIDKYPCVHGLACAIKSGIQFETLCSEYYLIEKWAKAYTEMIYPVPPATQWIVPEDIRAMYSLPPQYPQRQTGKGRKQQRRRTSLGEFGRRQRRTGRRSRWRRGGLGGMAGYFNCSRD